MPKNILRNTLKTINGIHLNLGIKKKFSVLSGFFYHHFGPNIINLDPASLHCNHKCIMCWQRTLTKKERLIQLRRVKTKSLRLNEYKKMFEQLPTTTSHINIAGGGEPLLYPKIWKLCELVKKYNCYGVLITNGSLLNANNIKKLFKIKWDVIRISLHAAERKTYAQIHGKDDFQKVIQAVKMIKKVKNKKSVNFMRLSLHYVIQRLNYNQILKFSKLAEELDVEEIEFNNLNPFVKKTLLHKNQLITVIKMLKRVSRNCPLPNNANIIVKRYENFYKKRGVKKRFILDKNRFLNKKCHFISDIVFLDAFGNAYPCCFFVDTEKKMGNVKKESILKIWQKPEYKKIRNKLLKGQFEPECFKLCSFIN